MCSSDLTAALLDIFTSVWQGIIPYGAQLLYASAGAAAVGLALTPLDFLPYLFYPFLMGISALLFIAFSKAPQSDQISNFVNNPKEESIKND